MKKKHLQFKQLKLEKETILNMSSVTGGAPAIPGTIKTDPFSADCPKTADTNCDTQGTVMPCCPACLSGANNTIANKYCTIVANTVDCQLEPMNPVG